MLEVKAKIDRLEQEVEGKLLPLNSLPSLCGSVAAKKATVVVAIAFFFVATKKATTQICTSFYQYNIFF